MKSEEIKDKIIELLSSTTRKDIDKVIEFLKSSDFFEAPASTKYHGNYNGGLAEHSLNVYRLFADKNEKFDLGLSKDNVIISALLHDFCKINFYYKALCWKKDKSNKWKSYIGYKVKDNFPVGHGEKSVIMIQHFIDLTKEEIFLIRWHMGMTEPKEMQMNLNNTYNIFPAAVAIHTADMEASYLLEIHVEPGETSKQMSFKA
ncbi:HD domain-containing protein [Clostridium tyrobutyricum]|uniref:HD domain-containing protein n=1 Tax=Clostridium tyrobutyricum TaxID=1519 RepID=UPI001C386888|nr:HD domain-containing protein [Clostridium tyrobutyricum]MBV4422944.1 HD domain-containing protein [Clostridium tyrobutyricum]